MVTDKTGGSVPSVSVASVQSVVLQGHFEGIVECRCASLAYASGLYEFAASISQAYDQDRRGAGRLADVGSSRLGHLKNNFSICLDILVSPRLCRGIERPIHSDLLDPVGR